MRIFIDGVAVEANIGSITAQLGITAIVNPADSGLAPGAGICGAIHSKAGPELYQECLGHAPLHPSKVVITSGHRLPNKYIIHCLPPTSRSRQAVQQLEKCYINSLLLAEEQRIDSVAFPSLYSGSLGTPPVSSTAIALGAVRKAAPLLSSVRRIRFVLFNRQIFIHYRNLMAANSESFRQTIG